MQTRWRDVSCTISSFVPSQTPRNQSVSTPQKSLYLSFLPTAAFLPSSTASSTRFFPKHAHGVAERKNIQAGAGGVECTGGDGRVCCIYHTRGDLQQNDRFITIILFSWLREAKIEIKIEIQVIIQPYLVGIGPNRLFEGETRSCKFNSIQFNKDNYCYYIILLN